MIPKTIHYCWLSGEDYPSNIKQCMDTWKSAFQDYRFLKWDADRFDVESNCFAAEAYRHRKWAFASDYIRLYALYNLGGIYLDCDVIVKRNFDEFSSHRFFSAVEYHAKPLMKEKTFDLINDDGTAKLRNISKPGFGLQAAIMGSEKGHPFVRDCLAYYKDRHFVGEDGEYSDKDIAPGIFAMIAEDYGFTYRNERQLLDEDMLILPSEVLASSENSVSQNAYAIHCCDGSWREGPGHWQLSALRSCQRKIKKRMPKLYAVARSAKNWLASAGTVVVAARYRGARSSAPVAASQSLSIASSPLHKGLAKPLRLGVRLENRP